MIPKAVSSNATVVSLQPCTADRVAIVSSSCRMGWLTQKPPLPTLPQFFKWDPFARKLRRLGWVAVSIGACAVKPNFTQTQTDTRHRHPLGDEEVFPVNGYGLLLLQLLLLRMWRQRRKGRW